jgi:uncharacterized protein YjcR
MTETQEKSPFVTIESLAQYFCVSVSTIRAWVRWRLWVYRQPVPP